MLDRVATARALLVGVEHDDREAQLLGCLDVGQLGAVVQAVVDDQAPGRERRVSKTKH